MVAEDCLGLAGAAAATSMTLLSVLSLLDVAFSASVLRGVAESVALLVCGLCCLQGETRIFYNYHRAVEENFGFALKPLGRGCAYLLGGLYCFGLRATLTAEAARKGGSSSSFFGLLWYSCCLLMLVGSAASVWMYRGDRRTQAMMMQNSGMADLDAYYISS
mmetsp:Transcript_91047/g.292101  ORF Transcript_91047/g.292101 Transcript_91047/m.292101 type:complete len:162 (-) Transcript_91047:52-537(-)